MINSKNQKSSNNSWKLLTILILIFNVLDGQKDLEKAEKYYEKKAYSYAIPIFEKIRDKTNEMDILPKLANSYLIVGEIEKSYYTIVEYLKKYVPSAETEDLYLEILKQNNKLEDISKLEIYSKWGSTKLQIAKLRELYNKTNNSEYDIINLKMNSSFSDFSLCSFNDYYIITSNRPFDNKNSTHTSNFNLVYFKKNDVFESTISFNPLKIEKNKNHLGAAFYDSSKKTLYYTTNNKSDLNSNISYLKIQLATISKDFVLENIKDFKHNKENFSVGHPYITPDGKKIYFASDRPGGYGGTDIYYCNLDENGEWGSPINLGNLINTKKNELFPYVDENNNLYFSSNGHNGFGGLDIFKATFNSIKLDKVENLGMEINSIRDDFGFVCNNKNCDSGFFVSNRTEGRGNDDIYFFSTKKVESYGIEKNDMTTNQDERQPRTLKIIDSASNKIIHNFKLFCVEKDTIPILEHSIMENEESNITNITCNKILVVAEKYKAAIFEIESNKNKLEVFLEQKLEENIIGPPNSKIQQNEVNPSENPEIIQLPNQIIEKEESKNNNDPPAILKDTKIDTLNKKANEFYSIQILNLSKLNISELEKRFSIKNLHYIEEKGRFFILIGYFDTEEAARTEQKNIKSKFNDCFVVKIVNQKRITNF